MLVLTADTHSLTQSYVFVWGRFGCRSLSLADEKLARRLQAWDCRLLSDGPRSHSLHCDLCAVPACCGDVFCVLIRSYSWSISWPEPPSLGFSCFVIFDCDFGGHSLGSTARAHGEGMSLARSPPSPPTRYPS